MFRIGVFAAAMIMALFALGWYWNQPEPNFRSAHNHGENVDHSHEHTHRGALGHDHDHPEMSDVTHSHSHQHGHFHETSTAIEPAGKLFEVGHIHGKDDVTVYWVDATQNGGEIRLQFYEESAGEIEKLELETDELVAEAFFELKSLGPIQFTKQDNQFVAKLPSDSPTFHSMSIVVGEIGIGEEAFNLKIQLPADTSSDDD